MILNCAIIDDEPLAAQLLNSYARKTPFLNVKGVFNSAVEAIKCVREDHINLLFLDIQMPELSGLEFAKILPPETKVVFTTAFSQYAVDSYKANAIGYLMKPISYESFLEASQKALEYFQTQQKTTLTTADRYFYVKSDYKLIKIKFDDLLYVEGLKDYVKFYVDKLEKPITSLMNLKKVAEFLPSSEFMRIHRSYIVNLSKITGIERGHFLIGSASLPVSDSYKDGADLFISNHVLS